ncbi:alpha-D-ribose 1-methylphosphonate 5-triphosphate diphosphatase [uncultured Tateyamaria sp.]|uniref:alpha-D-ribose 1-methylphosphonate 5-triphosphate diphosphatase n=1 Tax=uncultured Tateyamaria sp. TaxID=455651 RepID=UPI00261650A7|nr:alpha-D-ribose 1-methylphosphonate 5-triphosphate diphosphatase [uncultured Tateyamaria sp.]
MTQDTILANAQLVLPDEVRIGHIVLRDGHIADIGHGRTVPPGALDCGGDYVAPGLIELHTDNLERHISPRPKVPWPHGPAILAHDRELAGTGITTVFDAMRVGSIPSGKGRYVKYARALSSELLAMRAQGVLKISHFLHLRAEICSETLIEELAEFTPEDRVGIVSLMDHTPGQRQFRDITKMKAYVMGKNNLTEQEFADHVVKLQGLQDRLGARHEAAAVAEAGRLGAVLASHDDTTAPQVRVSSGHGVAVAEFPTTIEAAEVCRAEGIAIIMGAPNLVRGGSHSGNVAAQDLAERDLLDILSSDYVPAALLMSAVQLGALWGDMARGLATVTRTPARAVGLGDRGEIAVGQRADLVRFSHADGVVAAREVFSLGRQVA